MTDAATDQMITPALVRLDVSLGADKTEVIRALAAQVADAGRTSDPDRLAEDALAREATSADRAARRHRDPALPHRARSTYPPWRSPGSPRRPTSAPRTAPPTWRS